MSKYIPAIVVAVLFASVGFALSLTRTTVRNEGETGLKNLCQLIDANSVKLEALSGSDITTGNIASARITNSLTALKAAGPYTTNVFGAGSASTGTVVWATLTGQIQSITIAP